MATDLQPSVPKKTRPPHPDRSDRSIGELFKKLRNESATLFRQEMQLAKVETLEKARMYGRNSALLGVGAAVAMLGMVFILLGLSHGLTALFVSAGLTPMTSLWLGPLAVGVVVAIVGYIVLRKGLNTLKRETPVPEQTIRSLQENQEWVKHKFSHETRGS